MKVSDVDRLRIGTAYIVYTEEPHGTFHVGRFKGWQFDIAPDGHDMEETEFVTELPDGWEDRYPDMVFERALVGDDWMFEAQEEEMTLEELIELVERFKQQGGDPEGMHSLEDEIWEKTLMHIAFNLNDMDDARLWAHKALETTKVPHEKWYA